MLRESLKIISINNLLYVLLIPKVNSRLLWNLQDLFRQINKGQNHPSRSKTFPQSHCQYVRWTQSVKLAVKLRIVNIVIEGKLTELLFWARYHDPT